MQAIRQYKFGPAENLLYETVPDPHPAAGQVRIAVKASGVHLADTAIRAGIVSGPFQQPELPMTPGREVAGVVDEVGDGVGDRGGRGIGNLLVQAARNIGAKVVGVAGGAAKVEQVHMLGATVAVDYTEPDWAQTVREALGSEEVTVAFDGVGGGAGGAAFDLLGAGGRLILFGWSAGEPTRFTSGELFERGLSASVALGPRIAKLPGGLRRLEEESLTEAGCQRARY